MTPKEIFLFQDDAAATFVEKRQLIFEIFPLWTLRRGPGGGG